jgi:hypothetical protein
MVRWTALVGFAAVGLISCAGVLAARQAARTAPPRAAAPTPARWYILQSRTGTARYVNLGTVGDIPIPSRR